jgi:hypothetical protein
VSGWDGTGCALDTDAGGLKVTTSQANATAVLSSAEGLAAEVWLNGRFATIHWQCDEADSDAVLKIGPHSWNLAGGVADTDNETIIDLLRPDSTTSAMSNVQSIIPYEQPLALVNTPPWTHTSGGWDIPAGWGISRMTGVTITCANASAVYHFEKLSLTRKSEVDGGFAKLYVFPHQASWNDDRAFSDFALQSAGGDKYVYRKGFLVIDGAIVAELIAGWMWTFTDTGPHYTQSYVRLDERIGLWPLEDYTDIQTDPENAVLATPGVTYTMDPGSGFLADYCYVFGLAPGIYSPSANVISVDLKLPVRYINYMQGLNASDLIDACKGRWRGMAFGVAWTSEGIADEATIRATTPNASSGHESDDLIQTDALGWWATGPLNTKGVAVVHLYDVQSGKLRRNALGSLKYEPVTGQLVYGCLLDNVEAALRNRMITRVVIG